MARARSLRISRPAQVGLFVLAAIALLIIALWLFLNFGRSHGGYRIAARFRTVSGLAPGAPVYFSGTNIGTVTRIRLLPDNSVDVIMAITKNTDIPIGSTFSIQTSFTGSPTIGIVPPEHSTGMLPRRVLPVSEQPVGAAPLSIDQVMTEGRALGNRAQRVLKAARGRSGAVMSSLQQSRTNAAGAFAELKGVTPSAMAQMQSTIARARANAAQAQRVLPTRDKAKIEAAAASLHASAVALNASAHSLKSISRNPQTRANLHAVAANLKSATENMQASVNAFKAVTGNAQTRAELRDASAQLRAIIANLKSLL